MRSQVTRVKRTRFRAAATSHMLQRRRRGKQALHQQGRQGNKGESFKKTYCLLFLGSESRQPDGVRTSSLPADHCRQQRRENSVLTHEAQKDSSAEGPLLISLECTRARLRLV